MSHFVVLVIGKDPEKQLEPYWELDLPTKKLGNDPRAVFEVKIVEDRSEETFNQWKEENPGLNKKYNYENATEWLKEWHGFILKKGSGYGYYHNPNAKWDGFEIGGRWTGYFELKEGKSGIVGTPGLMTEPAKKGFVDQVKKGDVKNIKTPSAVVKNGIWFERGEMSWFGIVTNEKEKDSWEEEFRKLLEDVSNNTLLTVIDCHI